MLRGLMERCGAYRPLEGIRMSGCLHITAAATCIPAALVEQLKPRQELEEG